MNRPEISQYHIDLASLIKTEPDRLKRRDYLMWERTTPEYQAAKEEAIKETHRELTPQEQTILWAQNTLEEYNNLPKGNYAERKKVNFFLETTIDHLLQNPQEIDSSVSIWKARTGQEQDGFYEKIKQSAAKQIKDQAKKNPESIQPQTISELVKIYANNTLIKDFGEALLSSYFRGPEKRGQRVSAYYEFVFSIVDLLEDRKALEQGLRIALNETDILPISSPFFIDMALLGSGLTRSLKEEGDLKRLLIANRVISDVVVLTQLDREGVLQAHQKFLNKTENQIKKDVELKKMKAALGDSEARKRGNAMAAYLDMNQGVTGQTIERLKNYWPYSLVLDENDPLLRKFTELANPKIQAEWAKQNFAKEMREGGVRDIVFLSVPLPGGHIIDMCVPQILMENRNELMKYGINFNFPDGTDQYLEHSSSFFSTRMVDTLSQFAGYPIRLSKRKISEFERHRHQIQALELIGFPMTEQAKSRELADEILKRQIRFLNRRGVRVPISGQLKDMGYTYIDFHKDANPDKILVKVFVGETAYSVKLDKYLNLDFEGKGFDNLALAESLRYIFLSLLRPILCEERIKNPKEEIGSEEHEIISRMGHLRWLPAGQRFSKIAVENYLRMEQKDLYVTNLQRLEEHNVNRETTYVKPVIEKEENLPPITIHLPGVLQFK